MQWSKRATVVVQSAKYWTWRIKRVRQVGFATTLILLWNTYSMGATKQAAFSVCTKDLKPRLFHIPTLARRVNMYEFHDNVYYSFFANSNIFHSWTHFLQILLSLFLHFYPVILVTLHFIMCCHRGETYVHDMCVNSCGGAHFTLRIFFRIHCTNLKDLPCCFYFHDVLSLATFMFKG